MFDLESIMKKLNSNELIKTKRRNYIYLCGTLIFLVTTIVFIYIGYQEQHNAKKKAIPMSEISSDVSNIENKNAYIDVSMTPFLFATYQENGKESDEKFYLVMDKDKFLYIVYMSTADYQRLNKKDLSAKPIRIIGVTEEINTNIKELAISSYNKELGEEYLSEENFDSFVGPVMLNTSYIIDNSLLYYLISILSLCLFSVFLFIWTSNYFKNRKVLKQYSKEELEKIGIQIDRMGANPYQDMKLYFLKDYIADLSQGLTILRYEDIIWAYPYEYRYNGLLVNKSIKIINKTNQAFDIANTKYIKKDKEKVIAGILNKLEHKNKKIIIGYSREIKKIIKNKLKNKESLENIAELISKDEIKNKSKTLKKERKKRKKSKS